MRLKKLIRSFFKGVRRVNQKALHVGKSPAKAKAKPAAPKKRAKAASKVKTKAKALKTKGSALKAKGTAMQAKAKVKPAARPEVPEFKRTGVDPLSAMPNDPAHSPGHRKMNWKKYQETSKMNRRAVRP